MNAGSAGAGRGTAGPSSSGSLKGRFSAFLQQPQAHNTGNMTDNALGSSGGNRAPFNRDAKSRVAVDDWHPVMDSRGRYCQHERPSERESYEYNRDRDSRGDREQPRERMVYPCNDGEVGAPTSGAVGRVALSAHSPAQVLRQLLKRPAKSAMRRQPQQRAAAGVGSSDTAATTSARAGVSATRRVRFGADQVSVCTSDVNMALDDSAAVSRVDGDSKGDHAEHEQENQYDGDSAFFVD